jgi:MFS family permease
LGPSCDLCHYGLLIVILAAAVRDQLPRRRASSFAVVLLALLGVALMLAAFRVDTPMLSGGNPDTWNGWVHGIAFLLIIAMGVLAPLTMALAVRGDAAGGRSRSFPSRLVRSLLLPVLAVGQRLIPDGDRHALRLDRSGCRTPGDPYLINHPSACVADERGALAAAAL